MHLVCIAVFGDQRVNDEGRGSYAGEPRVCDTCIELELSSMHAHMSMVQAGAESERHVMPLLLSSLPRSSPAMAVHCART